MATPHPPDPPPEPNPDPEATQEETPGPDVNLDAELEKRNAELEILLQEFPNKFVSKKRQFLNWFQSTQDGRKFEIAETFFEHFGIKFMVNVYERCGHYPQLVDLLFQAANHDSDVRSDEELTFKLVKACIKCGWRKYIHQILDERSGYCYNSDQVFRFLAFEPNGLKEGIMLFWHRRILIRRNPEIDLSAANLEAKSLEADMKEAHEAFESGDDSENVREAFSENFDRLKWFTSLCSFVFENSADLSKEGIEELKSTQLRLVQLSIEFQISVKEYLKKQALEPEVSPEATEVTEDDARIINVHFQRMPTDWLVNLIKVDHMRVVKVALRYPDHRSIFIKAFEERDANKALFLFYLAEDKEKPSLKMLDLALKTDEKDFSLSALWQVVDSVDLKVLGQFLFDSPFTRNHKHVSIILKVCLLKKILLNDMYSWVARNRLEGHIAEFINDAKWYRHVPNFLKIMEAKEFTSEQILNFLSKLRKRYSISKVKKLAEKMKRDDVKKSILDHVQLLNTNSKKDGQITDERQNAKQERHKPKRTVKTKLKKICHPKERRAKKPKEKPTVEFRPTTKHQINGLAEMGARAYRANEFNQAASIFCNAHQLSVIDGLEDDAFLYAKAMAILHSKCLDNIQSGLNTLESRAEFCPYACLGLAKYYRHLRRESSSIDKIIEMGLKHLERDEGNCSSSQLELFRGVFPECYDNEILRRLLEDFASTHQVNAPPIGKCRLEECLNTAQTNLFQASRAISDSDLDYQGMYSLCCSLQCRIDYHPHCWKKFKLSMGVKSEKEMFGKSCLTPDCEGFIDKIKILKKDGEKVLQQPRAKIFAESAECSNDKMTKASCEGCDDKDKQIQALLEQNQQLTRTNNRLTRALEIAKADQATDVERIRNDVVEEKQKEIDRLKKDLEKLRKGHVDKDFEMKSVVINEYLKFETLLHFLNIHSWFSQCPTIRDQIRRCEWTISHLEKQNPNRHFYDNCFVLSEIGFTKSELEALRIYNLQNFGNFLSTLRPQYPCDFACAASLSPSAPPPPTSASTSATAPATSLHDSTNLRNICPICQDKMCYFTEVSLETCRHKFHQACIQEWKAEKAECPVCRAPIPRNSRFI